MGFNVYVSVWRHATHASRRRQLRCCAGWSSSVWTPTRTRSRWRRHSRAPQQTTTSRGGRRRCGRRSKLNCRSRRTLPLSRCRSVQCTQDPLLRCWPAMTAFARRDPVLRSNSNSDSLKGQVTHERSHLCVFVVGRDVGEVRSEVVAGHARVVGAAERSCHHLETLGPTNFGPASSGTLAWSDDVTQVMTSLILIRVNDVSTISFTYQKQVVIWCSKTNQHRANIWDTFPTVTLPTKYKTFHSKLRNEISSFWKSYF